MRMLSDIVRQREDGHNRGVTYLFFIGAFDLIGMRCQGKAGLAAAAAVLAIILIGVRPACADTTGRGADPSPVQAGKTGAADGGPSAEAGSAFPGGPLMERPKPATYWATVKPGTYVVRTIWDNTPLSGVRVEWRRHLRDKVPALTAITKGMGTAIFHPESGAYYLTAEWRSDGDYARPLKPGDRFAWFGGSPWLISAENSEEITMLLQEVPSLPAESAAPKAGSGVYGVVMYDGAPVADAGVFAYAKTGTWLRADDYQAMVRTNEKGEFALHLPPNRYYLLARLRTDKGVYIGPMHKGDLLGYDPRNPVVVETERYAASAIPMFKLRMEKTRGASSALPPATIKGRIVDSDGHPVHGVYAALYLNPKMVGMPVFISGFTGADGRFDLSVPVQGGYFLCSRSVYGRPLAGSWFGPWKGSADHSIHVRFGEVRSDIEIVVDRLSEDAPPFEEP